MAPIKRSRRLADDDDDGGGDQIVAVNSSLRQETRKRARLSGTSDIASKSQYRHLPSSPSEIEDTSAVTTKERALPSSTQHEIDRDAGFTHLDHADLDDQRATQRLLARTELIGENHASQNAIIESVTMVNFMCHERLHVTLGPLINFIVGRNGSGKSAILTAITLCLGGKASTTNRGGSLKSFIKEGRDHASLIVHLKNQGLDAYQPDLYGDTIIVERNFTKSGSSGFKLKNSAGRIVSTKKAEVDELIDYFQMQVDNPMTVLSQDNARQFLGASTPSLKYKFFVKGVQLEQLDNDYQLVSETADAMLLKLEDNRIRIRKLEEVVKAVQEKVDLVKEHEGLRSKIRKTGTQMAWAQVEEQEQKLERRESVVHEKQKQVEELETEVQGKDEKFQQTHIAFERAAEAASQVLIDLAPLREEEAESKNVHDAATQEMQNLHQEQRHIRDCLSEADKRAAAYRKDIDEEQKKLQDANGGVQAQKLVDLDLAQQKVTEAKARLGDSIVESPRLNDAYQAALEETMNAAKPIERKNKEIAACENRLQSLRRDIGSSMAGFPDRMQRLISAINDESGFREKPIGPVGLHIRLLKPIWSNALERSIGNVLNSFVVTSKADQMLLSTMIKKLDVRSCDVIIGNDHPIDTRGHEPDQQYDTVLRVLDIDNELIKRQLIISQGIEQTILVESRSDAMQIMYEGVRPQNVKQCFCLHDHQRGWGHRLSFMPSTGDPQSSAISPPYGKPRMKTDIDSQIVYHKETLEQLRSEVNALRLRQRELQQAAQKRKQAADNHKNEENILREQLHRAEEKVDQLKEQIDGFNIEDGRLEALKEFLREAEADVAQHGGSYGQAGVAKENQDAICLDRKRALDQIRVRIEDLEAEVKKSDKKTKRIRQARQIALQDKNLVIEALNGARSEKEAAVRKRDEQLGQVESFTRDASHLCVRVPIPSGETPASLDLKLRKYEKLIIEYNRKAGGTDEEIHQRHEVAVNAHRSATLQLEGLQVLYDHLKKAYSERLQKWRQFQRYISSRSRTNFTYLLSERGFRGKLLVDHKKKLLDIQVEPDLTLISAEGRQTKTLSGGEKSYSSICLLLSVWEAMGAPLRCLDEYDVFMDNINRDVSTKMIIGAARRSVGKQFILITPNTIGGSAALEEGKDVKLIRLSPPDQSHLAPL